MTNISFLILDLIKENYLYSSMTILVSFIITKKIIIPFFTKRKMYKLNKFSFLRIGKLFDFLKQKKTKNYIFSYLNMGQEYKISNSVLDNSPSDIIKNTKRIIKKLTEDFIKTDKKTRNNKYDSRKDQIFYFLLNNMHVIKGNNNQNFCN
jgi:hypothetical protein